jgi:hypothetical protein
MDAQSCKLLEDAIRAKRDILMRVHHWWLSRPDIEECMCQAELELFASVKRGHVLRSFQHACNSLEQKFVSRIADQRRAIGGRSATKRALNCAYSLSQHYDKDIEEGGWEPSDAKLDVFETVSNKLDLQAILDEIQICREDFQKVFHYELFGSGSRADYAASQGWGMETFRKIDQRGRQRLRAAIA